MLAMQMELVDDVTLRELIEKGPISVEDCWRMLRQILNALVHIHNLGIVHRDLKVRPPWTMSKKLTSC